jgi:predicted nucleic acid-binding Zn ribbon protein
MTREEAIEQLQDAKDGYKEYLSNDALDIAIKALEHPEKNVVAVVPCGDCISRADAIHAVSEALERAFVEHEDIANKLIGKLPAVTPQEPKTGHWVGIDEYPHEDYECDNCGFIHTFIDGHTAQYNYCPNCGADMSEVKE